MKKIITSDPGYFILNFDPGRFGLRTSGCVEFLGFVEKLWYEIVQYQ